MSPLERKEKFLAELEQTIIDKFGDRLIVKFETCSLPAFGWSQEEYLYMPIVADRLRAKGYSVTSSVNHGVVDWVIGI